jgi:hypothetical protein
LGFWIRPQAVGAALVSMLWLALGWRAKRGDFHRAASPGFRRLLGVVALVALAVVAKSFYSVGPEGELFRGTVSRNFEMADRIDSRYSFYVVQGAGRQLAPYAPQLEAFFAPWTFFSRGPLAGLAAIPVVMATNGVPPAELPEQRWRPFDPTGFSAYRITMIVLASTVIVALFLLLVPLAGEGWALIGAGLLALAPFGLHEMMFTWPKWAATAWLIAAFALAHARRPCAAGFALSIGFLFHPLALLWAPWLALWSAGRDWASARARIRAFGYFCFGVGCVVLPWMLLGALMPHLPTTPLAGQGGFFRYFLLADWQTATWASWWHTRWMNFANTFIPLHGYMAEASFNHPKLNSAYEPSGPLVKFSQLWWNSLPFAMGLGLWLLSLLALGRGWRMYRPALVLLVVSPALFVTAYWGMDPLGLMRECGHPLLVALIALTVLIGARQGGGLGRALAHPAMPWLQLPETWLMLWLTTLVNPRPSAVADAQLDWLYVTINAGALTAAAIMLSRARRPALVFAPAAPAPARTEPGHARGAIGVRPSRVAWTIFGFGVLAVAIAPWRPSIEDVRLLSALDNSDASGGNDVFKPNAVFATDRFEAVPPGIATRGSWIGSDSFTGTHVTGWFRAAPRVALMVSGYPLRPGNRLELEVRGRDGALRRLPFDLHDVGEAWLRWTPALPRDAEAFRIHASDSTDGPGGWLGFSHPFTSHPLVGPQLWSLLQLIAMTCLGLTLLYGPGWLWFRARPRPAAALGWAILPGPLLLVALGGLCWAGGGILPPAVIARAGVLGLLAAIGWVGWRRPAGAEVPPEIRLVVAGSALLAGFAVAKANVSFGPKDELFHDRISRTLALGHSDSQISFHVVQVVAHHLSPYADQTRIYFAPWRFASRGPLSGLLAAPMVLASGARVPFDHPTHPWRPFDREGFSVYRIACIVVASLTAWAVFATAAALASPAWGLFAAGTALLAPFFVHEVFFTWPKLIAAAFVLLSFVSIHGRRPFCAGLLIALGYLFHPGAVLSGPFLALWLVATPGSWQKRLVAPAWFAAGALLLVVPWQFMGRLHPDENADQRIFLQYFFFADNSHATFATWCQSRWRNFANTFLPLYLFLTNNARQTIDLDYGNSDRWVQASFLYWNTLPFALGGPGFLLACVAVFQACRRALAVTCVALLGPALFLIVYWGAASTGLMRQCGHALFLSVIIVTVWSLATWPNGWRDKTVAFFQHPICFAWRGGEVAVMAFGTTLLNRRPDFTGLFGWNDTLSLAIAAGLLGALTFTLYRAGASFAPASAAPKVTSTGAPIA